MAYTGGPFYSNDPLMGDWSRQFNGLGRNSVPDLHPREHSTYGSQMAISNPSVGPQQAGGFPTRATSLPHNSFSPQPNWSHESYDLQPCWNIWGSPPRNAAPPTTMTSQTGGHVSPLQGPAPGPTSIPNSAVSAPSPPLNATRYSPVLQASNPSSFWFGHSHPAKQATSNGLSGTVCPVTINRAHDALASPPLSPQSSWELGETVANGKLASLSPPRNAIAESAAKDLFLETYFDDLNHQGSLYDPVPAVGELEGVIAPISTPLYLVKFKNGRTDVYTVSEKTIFPIAVGNLVLVDADRGRDIGKVFAANVPIEQAAFIKWKQYHERQQVLSQCTTKEPGTPLTACSPKHILRVAQPNEVRQFTAKRAEEQKAVRICNQKVRERNLDMTIVDAEYQWDHRKLTFFYNANQRVDFRDLVRELFRMYKTRIWMCAVNSC